MITITEFTDMIGNDYLAAFIVLAAFLLISKIFVFIMERVLLKLAKKTETKIDDLILDIMHKPVFYLLILVGVLLSLEVLGLDSTTNNVLYNIVHSILVLVIGYLAAKILNVFITHWGEKIAKKTESDIDDQLVGLFKTISIVVMWAFALIFALKVWNVDVGPFVASLGIAGVAIAFALQSTLGNVFGGVSLIIDKSIKADDVVELDDGTSGTIMNVGLRSTRIRTWNNEILIIPNGNLANAKIVNYVQPDDKVRVVVPFGVAYGSNINQVKKIALKEISKVAEFSKEPEPFVVFKEMADSALNFTAYFYVNSYSKRFMAKDEANTRIYDALNAADIEIPFPQMDVHVKTEESDKKESKKSKKTVSKKVRRPKVGRDIKG